MGRRTLVTLATLALAVSAVPVAAAAPATALGSCYAVVNPHPGTAVNICNHRFSWPSGEQNSLDATAKWDGPNRRTIAGAYLYTVDGYYANHTVYLDVSKTHNHPGDNPANWDGWVVRGEKGNAETVGTVPRARWIRACATGNGQFHCTGWAQMP